MRKYYQVFISSVTKDFASIRREIIEAVLSENMFFPIAMEYMKTASNTYSMLFNYMTAADIVVLLLGMYPGMKIGEGVRYIRNQEILTAIEEYKRATGLKDPGDLTYTELEYVLALHLRLPVLPFVKKELVDACENKTADSSLMRIYNHVRQIAGYTLWESKPDGQRVVSALKQCVSERSDLTGWIREKDSQIFQSASKAGVLDISLDGIIPKEKLYGWLERGEALNICYTTGQSFILSYSDRLTEFVARGGHVRFLCCKPNTAEMRDIQIIEESVYGNREKIHDEFSVVCNVLSNVYTAAKNANKGTMGTIEVGFLSTLFRSSFLVVENSKGKNGWLTVTLPPAKSRETISFEMSSREEDTTNKLIKRVTNYFNAVWEYAKQKGEIFLVEADVDDIVMQGSKQEEYWNAKKERAVKNMRIRKRTKKKILIEVAAQHPLKEGLYPNEEFSARLDTAVKLYEEKKREGIPVEIYVPGSVHLDEDGIADECALSEAGCAYLLKKGIPEECLHGDEWNVAFDEERIHKGVYNTADECYIASRFFLRSESDYFDLYSVCSPNQLMRKTLFYIEFGVYPKIITVPVANMYHDFFNELLFSVPYILGQDHTYQGENSKEAIRTRRERLPGYSEE